ncbi:hypothetical protein [Sandaracinobacteroides sayramensis]|uniref:hypothetical protein n=1 Tax=Sandaracinobacteroides sayramensis TaxID=2913411 RepID=UPI001EDC2CDA|nr:hypothetical protein [Sandaracinobacteroides sayramensis]
MLALLLLCALAMRMAVPAGYMPAFGNGTASLVLCSAFGDKRIDVDFGKAGSTDQQAMDLPCVFASTPGAIPAFTGAQAGLLAWPLVSAAFFSAAIADLTTHRLAAPPPPALGPPAQA